MKLFRFMSKKEYIRFMNGEKLINNTDHKKYRNGACESVGFCFFNYAEYKPEEMLHSVTGIVSMDICCIFETARDKVRKSRGKYSKAITRDSLERESIIAKEYCTTEYSKETFRLLEYAEPDWFNWEEWEWKKV